jgi:hypothetical protein
MDTAISAAKALTQSHISGEQFDALAGVYSGQKNFMKAVKEFDAWIAANKQVEPLAEYAFDLLLAHHLEQQRGNEDYFDTKEWMDIEDKTIDRGTELLNLLLYISEAFENDVEIELGDFLYEFLLVDEDEFQDEHRIYEDVIDALELMDESDADFLIALKETYEGELEDLFKPMLIFFKSPKKMIDTGDVLNERELAVYDAIMAFAGVS